MNRRRIFVALPIAPELQHDIARWEERYADLPVRWLTGKNLHITLVPPWYTENVRDVIARLKEAEGVVNTFDTHFMRVTFGPNARAPRLIWAEGETPKNLGTLKDVIVRALDVEPEKRLFKLHLTLARFRPETFSSFSVRALDELVSWQQKCDHFVLMESHLSRSGADYEILESFNLLT